MVVIVNAGFFGRNVVYLEGGGGGGGGGGGLKKTLCVCKCET